MPRPFARPLPLVLAATLLAGCQTMESKNRQESLDKVLHAYETAIRWGYIRQAYNLMRPERLEEIEIPQGLENIKVTRYEVLEPAVSNPKSNNASQVAYIDYVERDRQQERRIADHQLWEYDPGAKRWYLISDIPAFVRPPRMRPVPPGR